MATFLLPSNVWISSYVGLYQYLFCF